jgi:hypothetical protein
VIKIFNTLASSFNNIADMSEKAEQTGIRGGKVPARRVPEAVDLSDLKFLEYRDVKRVAEDMQLRPDFVARVKRGESYNVKVLAALLKKARANKDALSPS